MKTLICQQPGVMEYVEKDIPTPADNEVLLKIKAVGICGTDIHAFAGRQPFFSYPRVLGHEICAEAVSRGSQCQTAQSGQRYSVIPCIPCGECAACREEKTNCCERVSLYGVHQDGGFSEYLAVREDNLVPLPDEVSDSAGALVECFAIGAHAVRRAEIKAEQNVLVIGAGPIGLATAAIARAKGAHVVVADIDCQRRQHVVDHLAINAFNPTQEDFIAALREAFGGELACVVLDATGNKASMSHDVNLIRHGGKIVFIGLYIGELVIDDPTFHKKETTLLSSRNATREDFALVIELMRSNKIHENLKSLVHHKLHTAGLDTDTTQQVTDVLVHADITGVHSHGVMRVEHYCTRLAAGGLNKAPQFSIEQISPSVAILDSDDGMGHSALISATEHAIKLAQQEGLGFVSVKNTSHCGALSYFAEMITNKGLVAIVMTQTDTCVAPHGGAERFLGTNPIAFGFPVENSHPMIVDMATSATAFGKILHAKETGKHIGEGLAIDKNGYGTTDPYKIENLLPFGQHKGSGIALAIDALTGVLMNANFGNHIVRMYGDYDKMRKLASLVIAIDPKKLGNPVFAKTMAKMVTELHAVKPAPGVEKVLAPNDPQMHYKEKCQQEGIPVPAGIFHYLAEN